MRVDRATAASFEAPPEKGNREKQRGGEKAEPGVEGRERRPVPEPDSGNRTREKAREGERDRGFREAQMGAKQIWCPRLAPEPSAAQTQTGSQRESHDPEARDHPQGMHVGVEFEQRVSRGGVQSLHLVNCTLRKIGQ